MRMFIIFSVLLLVGLQHCNATILDGEGPEEKEGTDSIKAPELMERYEKLRKLRQEANNSSRDYQDEGNRRMRGSNVLTMELAMFTDSTFLKKIENRYPYKSSYYINEVIRKLVLAIVSSAEIYLNHKSFGQKFKLVIVLMDIQKRQLIGRRNPLGNFCYWQRKQRRSRGMDWDHAVLLTGDLFDPKLSGKAYGSSMCDKGFSCSITKLSFPGGSGHTMAHELAHSLGVEDHDGEGDSWHCHPRTHIMGPAGSSTTEWSHCSKQQMQVFIDEYGKECLTDRAKPKKREWDHSRLGLPGQIFDSSQQCHLRYGKGSSQRHRWSKNSCNVLFCANQRYSDGPAFQGTECGYGNHCYDGKCVRKNRK